MEYSVDINDSAVQEAMQSLDINANDLLLHDISFFKGPEKIQKLRFEHHSKRVQKLSKQIKEIIRNSKSPKLKKHNFSFDTEQSDTQESSVLKVKAKFKMNLSMQIKLENQRRSKLSSSMQKLLRKEVVTEKRRGDVEKKKVSDSLKREAIQMRLSGLLRQQRQKTQQWSERLTRVNSRMSNFSPQSKKPGTLANSFSRASNDEGSIERLKGLNEKIERSMNLHKELLKETSLKMADHNSKVNKTLRTQMSIEFFNKQSKLLNVMEKINSFDNRKIKKKMINEMLLSKKLEKKTQKWSKVQDNAESVSELFEKKINKIEKKKIIEKNKLMCHLEEFNKEKEYKSVKQQLRDEDAKENLKRIKKFDIKKRDELLERHLEERKKFYQLKEYREKANEKIRYEAAQAKHEHIKAKMVHIQINKADDPSAMMKLIEKKF